ncbi:MAG: hypothetical protein AAGC68_05335 [Verrucomicrobiota bacterium]
MQNHKTACLTLVIAIVGMLYGVNELRNSTESAKLAMRDATSSAENAEAQAENSQMQLTTLDHKTSQLRQVYTEWKPFFENLRTAQDAERRIADVVREGDVFLISQKFESKEVDKNPLIPETVVADLIVEDDFTKTMNWLGRLEEKIPNSRISRANMKRGDRGNDIHLELQVQIPVLE